MKIPIALRRSSFLWRRPAAPADRPASPNPYVASIESLRPPELLLVCRRIVAEESTEDQADTARQVVLAADDVKQRQPSGCGRRHRAIHPFRRPHRGGHRGQQATEHGPLRRSLRVRGRPGRGEPHRRSRGPRGPVRSAGNRNLRRHRRLPTLTVRPSKGRARYPPLGTWRSFEAQRDSPVGTERWPKS